MDGVVVVALPAGTLHYARSLSERFDRRHPRADRMNLAALIFALHSFAANTITQDAATTTRIDTTRVEEDAAIKMFATPDERMAIALSPSKKLLVALFTSPKVDEDEAKWIATRIAHNFEATDSVDSRIMATLNHVPGLFRSAFVRAIESYVDLQLTTFGASVRNILVDSVQASSLDGAIGFYYRYNPSDLGESKATTPDRDTDEGIVEQPIAGDLSSFPSAGETRPAAPPGKLTRLPSRIEAGSSLFLSTRSLLAVPRVAPDHDTTKRETPATSKKRTKKKHKNAVVDHAEPRVFQRVVRLDGSLSAETVPQFASQCSSSLASEQIANLVGSLLDAVDTFTATRPTDNALDSPAVRLLTWGNPPLSGVAPRTNSSSRPGGTSSSQQNDLVAWQLSHAILYCLVPSATGHCIANNASIVLQVDKMLNAMDQTVHAMLSS